MFCQQAEVNDLQDMDPIIAEPGVGLDSSDEEEESKDVSNRKNDIWPSPNKRNASEERLTGRNRLEEIGNEIDSKRSNLASEFLSLHHRSGHITFQKL